jgi:hypothetical protein
MSEYSLFFSLIFCLEKITFRLLNIEFIKPRPVFQPLSRGKSAAGAQAVWGPEPRAPELDIPRPLGAGMGALDPASAGSGPLSRLNWLR